MKKVMVAYFSLSGKTEKMAEYIAEGVRFAGCQTVVRRVSTIKNAESLAVFDGYIFGSPTYHRDMAEPMKTLLFLVKKAETTGKLAGAFGSYTHSGDAPAIILDTMEHVFKMPVSDLASLNMIEAVVDTVEGIRACQDYGKNFGEKLMSQ